jgi:hypothetical protein
MKPKKIPALRKKGKNQVKKRRKKEKENRYRQFKSISCFD